MTKVLIVYFSRTGNTEQMAQYVAEGAKETGGDVTLKKVADTSVDELKAADAVVLGSPTYYGHSSGEMRRFLDKSIKYHGQLEGKVGGAFASAANIGGGNETTVLDLLHALLVHGMIVAGTAEGDHYGPVSIGAPDERVKAQCRALGERVTALAAKVSG
ncbi:MAG: NAD(P)H-dependent oxidoreductase [Lentisphaerae bacterium]|nr:NAD(P)H-dependent oxidoreductase [Lentisphaerota bacterium]